MRVADELRAVVRAGDTVARLGGDEFVVLLEDAGSADATGLAAAVIDRLSGSPPGTPLRVTASVGVAFAEAGTSASELLRRADRALYGAKGRGKTTFVVADAAE